MMASIFASANFWFITEAIVVIGGSCVGVWKVVHNALTKSVADNLRSLHAEMQPNHGSSMRDAIDRIERSVEDLKLELARHLGAHEGL
jgi:hypothetical protein